jgi:hypothetical protein
LTPRSSLSIVFEPKKMKGLKLKKRIMRFDATYGVFDIPLFRPFRD